MDIDKCLVLLCEIDGIGRHQGLWRKFYKRVLHISLTVKSTYKNKDGR